MNLSRLVQDHNVIVCCGAGGVGKTTVSAGLALSAARRGRKALVLTIDPARRLAQALGIPPTGKEPVQIHRDVFTRAGIALPEGGELHAWMLDPAAVLETVVDRFSPSAEGAARIRATRLYTALKEVMAGLQEHTAAEALYDFTEHGDYDLIVLDTPPSRNALDFLDAPRRLARFLDERTLSIFAPKPGSRPSTIARAASKVVNTALAKAFTPEFVVELQQFLGAFGSLFGKMRVHAQGVRELLKSDRACFVVITSADQAAYEEALFFKRRVTELGLSVRGFILNRSYASDRVAEHPDVVETDDPLLKSALLKLAPLAEAERNKADQDRELLGRLMNERTEEHPQSAVALPYLDETVEDLAALARLSDSILRIPILI